VSSLSALFFLLSTLVCLYVSIFIEKSETLFFEYVQRRERKAVQPTNGWFMFAVHARLPLILSLSLSQSHSHCHSQEPEIERFIQRVKFTLHDSFAPHHKIVVTQPPFQVTKKGWGEFVVRVRLYFWDPKAEPVDIDYELKVS
jgi:hypothetical protein